MASNKTHWWQIFRRAKQSATPREIAIEKYRFLNDGDFAELDKMLPSDYLKTQLPNIFEHHQTYLDSMTVMGWAHKPDSRLEVALGTGERFYIAQRVYIPRVADYFTYKVLALDYRLAYFAIMSRSANGYLREKFTRELLKVPHDRLPEWALPYLLMSLSDYVYEVSSLLVDAADDALVRRLQSFAACNPAFMKLIKDRAISYTDLNGIAYRNSKIRTLLTRLGYSK